MNTTKVISLSKRNAPHIEHQAVINTVWFPDNLKGSVAITKCGRILHNFSVTEETSDLFTDGTIYKTACPRCQEDVTP